MSTPTPRKFPEVKFAYFDVLGFKSRFSQLGLTGILDKYLSLISLVRHANKKMSSLSNLPFTDDAAWIEGDAFILNGVYGAYGSDSLMLWANHWFPGSIDLEPHERDLAREQKPHMAWQHFPIPNDRFIEVCNELICHAIEQGLPLRGALATGTAAIDVPHTIFLGQPIIDAVVLEGAQRFVGASLAKSIHAACTPSAYKLEYSSHLKSSATSEQSDLYSGFVLDWPAHWMRTRSSDILQEIRALSKDSGAADVYTNTAAFIEASVQRGIDCRPNFPPSPMAEYDQFRSRGNALSIYPQFEDSPHPLFSIRGV